MSALKTIFKHTLLMLSTVAALRVMQVSTEQIWRPIVGISIILLAAAYYYND